MDTVPGFELKDDNFRVRYVLNMDGVSIDLSTPKEFDDKSLKSFVKLFEDLCSRLEAGSRKRNDVEDDYAGVEIA